MRANRQGRRKSSIKQSFNSAGSSGHSRPADHMSYSKPINMPHADWLLCWMAHLFCLAKFGDVVVAAQQAVQNSDFRMVWVPFDHLFTLCARHAWPGVRQTTQDIFTGSQRAPGRLTTVSQRRWETSVGESIGPLLLVVVFTSLHLKPFWESGESRRNSVRRASLAEETVARLLRRTVACRQGVHTRDMQGLFERKDRTGLFAVAFSRSLVT